MSEYSTGSGTENSGKDDEGSVDKENGVIDMASAAKVSEALKDMKLTAGADTTITVKGVTTTATDNTLTLPETSDADLTIVLDGVKTTVAPLTVSTPALGHVTILLKDGAKDLNLNVTAPYATVTIASEGQSTIENLVVKTSSDVYNDWNNRALTLDKGVKVNFLNILQTIVKDEDGNIKETTTHGYVLVNDGAEIEAVVVDDYIESSRTWVNDHYEYGVNYRYGHVLHNQGEEVITDNAIYRISGVKAVKGTADYVEVYGRSYADCEYPIKKVTIDSKATAYVRNYVEEVAGLINGTDTAKLIASSCSFVSKVSNVIATGKEQEYTTWYNGEEIKYKECDWIRFGGELSNAKVKGQVAFYNYYGSYNVSNVKFEPAHVVIVKDEWEFDQAQIELSVPSKKDAGGAFTHTFSTCAFNDYSYIRAWWRGQDSTDPILDENGEQKHLIYWRYKVLDKDGNFVKWVEKDSIEDFTLAERKENHIEKVDIPLFYANPTPAYDKNYVSTLALTNCTKGGINYTKSSNVSLVSDFQTWGDDKKGKVKYQINGVDYDIVDTNAGLIFN